MTKQGGWPDSGFGQKLKFQREKAGLTQAALAEKAGCHPMTLAKLERGVQEPAWPLVLALCKALGVDCTAFATDAPASNATPAPAASNEPQPTKATSKEKKPAKGKK